MEFGGIVAVPYISSLDLQAYLRLPEGVLNSDMSAIALDSATEVVSDYCSQKFSTTSFTDLWLDGWGTVLLDLKQFPVLTFTALSTYSADRSGEEALTENVHYILDYAKGLAYRVDGGIFPKGRLNIKASFTAGYATVPSPVRLVSLQMAARIYEFGMMTGESTGSYSGTYVPGAGSLTREEKDVLRRYRV